MRGSRNFVILLLQNCLQIFVVSILTTGGIIALVAVGAIVAHTIIVTFNWLKRNIKERIFAKKAKKVAVADLNKLIDECDNKTTISDLDEIANEGYTHIIASVNDNDVVEDVEIIKNTNDEIDEEVDNLINRTGKGMVVIER